VRKLLVCLLICCSGILLARVQGQQAKSTSPDKLQIFGGYTFQRSDGFYNPFSFNTTCEESETPADECNYYAPFNSNGGQVAVSYFPWHHFGITAQLTFETSGNKSFTYYEDDPTASITAQSYLFGPVYRYRTMGGRLSLFYHTLFGFTHNTFSLPSSEAEVEAFCYKYDSDTPINPCSSNNFTVATGGGVDIGLSRHFAVRPAQFEYWTEQIPYSAYESGDPYPEDKSGKYGIDGFRYSAGFVANF
jgi:hypothetical protein